MRLKKIAAALVCAALAVSMAACKFTTPATVLNVDGQEIPAGIYLMYQYQAYMDAKALREDTEKAVLQSEIEGMDAQEWIHEQTLLYARRYVWVNSAFEEAGLSFSEVEQATIGSQIESALSYNEELLAENGIGPQSYRTYYETEAKYQKLRDAYLEEERESVSDADAKAYMEENYSRIQTLVLPVSDADAVALSEEELAKVEALADELVEKLNAGGTMDELAEDTLQAAFDVCGREFGEDSLTSYSDTSFVMADSAGYTKEFISMLMSAQVGDAGLYDEYSVPMIYQKVANYEDDEDFADNYRTSIVDEMNTAAFDERIEEEAAGYALTEDASAVRTYSPSKIKETL